MKKIYAPTEHVLKALIGRCIHDNCSLSEDTCQAACDRNEHKGWWETKTRCSYHCLIKHTQYSNILAFISLFHSRLVKENSLVQKKVYRRVKKYIEQNRHKRVIGIGNGYTSSYYINLKEVYSAERKAHTTMTDYSQKKNETKRENSSANRALMANRE